MVIYELNMHSEVTLLCAFVLYQAQSQLAHRRRQRRLTSATNGLKSGVVPVAGSTRLKEGRSTGNMHTLGQAISLSPTHRCDMNAWNAWVHGMHECMSAWMDRVLMVDAWDTWVHECMDTYGAYGAMGKAWAHGAHGTACGVWDAWALACM